MLTEPKRGCQGSSILHQAQAGTVGDSQKAAKLMHAFLCPWTYAESAVLHAVVFVNIYEELLSSCSSSRPGTVFVDAQNIRIPEKTFKYDESVRNRLLLMSRVRC